MSRRATFTSLLAFFVCFVAFLSPGEVSVAEGCPGAELFVCSCSGWASVAWDMDPDEIPTNGILRIRLEPSSFCEPAPEGSGGGMDHYTPGVSIEIEGPDGLEVKHVDNISGPFYLTYTYYPESTYFVTYLYSPSEPFVPYSNYKIRFDGLLGGPVELSFKTGQGPHFPPKPSLENPTISEGIISQSFSICCQKKDSLGCFLPSECVPEFIETVPQFSAEVTVDDPVDPKETLTTNVEVSVDEFYFYSVSVPVNFPQIPGKICARARVTSSLTNKRGFRVWGVD